jgi:hypothetical protein
MNTSIKDALKSAKTENPEFQPIDSAKIEKGRALAKFNEVLMFITKIISPLVEVKLKGDLQGKIRHLRKVANQIAVGFTVGDIESTDENMAGWSFLEFVNEKVGVAVFAMDQGNFVKANHLLSEVIDRKNATNKQDDNWAQAQVRVVFNDYMQKNRIVKLRTTWFESNAVEILPERQYHQAEGALEALTVEYNEAVDAVALAQGFGAEVDEAKIVTKFLMGEAMLQAYANKVFCHQSRVSVFSAIWTSVAKEKRNAAEDRRKSVLARAEVQAYAEEEWREKRRVKRRAAKARRRARDLELTQKQQRGKVNAEQKQRQKAEERLGNTQPVETVEAFCARIGLTKVQTVLKNSGKTVLQLINSTEDELLPLVIAAKGVGPKTAPRIVAKILEAHPDFK